MSINEDPVEICTDCDGDGCEVCAQLCIDCGKPACGCENAYDAWVESYLEDCE